MPDPASRPKVAAVTWGIGGIGQGVVIALTQRDNNVVGCDPTIDPVIAERMTTDAAPRGGLCFIGNDPADLPRFVDAIFAAFGRIECPINNAGVSAKSRGHVLDVSAESHDLNFALNARSAFFLTQVVRISSSNAVIAARPRMSGARSRPSPRVNSLHNGRRNSGRWRNAYPPILNQESRTRDARQND
jgi:NAD(P)-dependent dehydrogenase (short-subunit alcohol dehydrogenase family)